MKTILIIQSLIILAGAYYLYTLSQEVVEETAIENTQPALEVSKEAEPEFVPPVEIESESTVDQEDTISGPSDAGMEYPIMDSEVEVQ